MKYVLRSWNNVVLGLNYQKNVGYTLEKGFLSTPGPVWSVGKTDLIEFDAQVGNLATLISGEK